MSISTTTSSNKEREEHKVCEDYSMFKNQQLGKGGFGQLYLGKNLKNNSFVAVKVEDRGSRSHLNSEFQILSEISKGEGIPKVYKFHKGHKHIISLWNY